MSVPRSPAYPAGGWDKSPFPSDGQRTRDVSAPRDDVRPNGDSLQPPSGPSSHRNARNFGQSASRAPLTGPAASTMSMSAHSRGGGPSTFSAQQGRVAVVAGLMVHPATSQVLRLADAASLVYRGPSPHGPIGGGYVVAILEHLEEIGWWWPGLWWWQQQGRLMAVAAGILVEVEALAVHLAAAILQRPSLSAFGDFVAHPLRLGFEHLDAFLLVRWET
ncbi:hypothetical protein LTR93_011953 [Exophiala xenobiotica]|nr:hypothetical protein LTR93_011953 [Exophiala xenobiotica]